MTRGAHIQNKMTVKLAIVAVCTLFISHCEATITNEEVFKILGTLDTLNSSLAKSMDEHSDSLNSLYYSLLKLEAGMKNILNELATVKHALNSFHVPSTQPPIARTNVTYPHAHATFPAVPDSCEWPADNINGRCILLVTETLKTWQEARDYCWEHGGTLGTNEALAQQQERLTELFGINSDTRARWDFWTGARMDERGWYWDSCPHVERVSHSSWKDFEPRPPNLSNDHAKCMVLSGFDDYKGKSVSCNAARRFLCDLGEVH